MTETAEPLVAPPTSVKAAASYLGTSQKGLQFCLDRGYTAKQTAQYLGLSEKGVQRAFAKFTVLAVGLTTKGPGRQIAVAVSGSSPGGTVVVSWGDAATSNVVCDADGAGTSTHTYAANGTYAVGATQSTRTATGFSVTFP